ncbi:23S rRNA (uracil(1939)-C(5))-methyltransferase RlmD [Coprothermobacter platensis]|uniref:23S rRNA (uracil(1939)-C(5))-methyltransferase RlmD n=1 Tax=Coprothermobacter platensis TaxID=108819 RepID=UPI00035CC778|nr:23S rRNA (uracil(1939)-C(5))-methyltransferase RlmD [Coprothermobacter platensis]
METLEIIDLTVEGFGVAKSSGLVYFVKGNVAPGDVVKAIVTATHKNYVEADVVEIISSSNSRVQPQCPHFSTCGGCQLQHISYQSQLQWKTSFVTQNISRFAHEKLEKVDITPSIDRYGYRAKAHFTFGKEGSLLDIGYFDRTDKWFPIETCPILRESVWETAKTVINILRSKKLSSYFIGNGTLRHLQIRVSLHTGEKQALITFSQIPHNHDALAQELLNAGIDSLAFHQNSAHNKTVIGSGNTFYYGSEYIQELLMNKIYAITPLSFFQINPTQAEELFSVAMQMLEPQCNDIVFEGYAGVGAFTLLYAPNVKNVIAAEGVAEATNQAKENAALNNVDNVEFLAQSVESAAISLTEKVDKVVVDPPRNGMTQDALNAVAKLNPERIVYISCDPSTLARDANRFHDFGYTIRHINAVDMFPQTTHVESVALLMKVK